MNAEGRIRRREEIMDEYRRTYKNSKIAYLTGSALILALSFGSYYYGYQNLEEKHEKGVALASTLTGIVNTALLGSFVYRRNMDANARRSERLVGINSH